MVAPNLIIVIADELRQQAVGPLKSDPVFTPNIDAFGADSLILSNALANCPICSPSRAMLFSGKYPVSNGVIDNCYSLMNDFNVELKEDEYCFSDVLSDAGYSQGYIGKYHLDLPKAEDAPFTEGWRGDPEKGGTLWDAYTPPGKRRHGFDFWYSYGCCDQHFTPHYWKNNAKVDERIDIQGWSVEHETNVAIDYIKNKNNEFRDSNKPFFLVVSHNPPHMPFHEVPEKYKTMYKDISAEELLNRSNVDLTDVALRSVADYFAAITGIDENFGRILEAIKEEDIEKETIVVFMSDHGESLGSHGRMGKNTWQNEAFLIPFIIRWKGKIVTGTDDILFNMPDLMPTLLGVMGLKDRIPEEIEGSDRSDVFFGAEATRPDSGYYLTAQPLFPEERRGIKTLKHTFVVIRKRETGEVSYVLHDNEKDPFQLLNIADTEPKLVKNLSRKLEEWLIKTNDPWAKNKEVLDWSEGKNLWSVVLNYLSSFGSPEKQLK